MKPAHGPAQLMVFVDSLRSPLDAQLKAGARWVISSLEEAANARGLLMRDYKWTTDDDIDGEDRCVLSFQCDAGALWEPFDPADLEDLTSSDSVRTHLANQLRQLINRVEQVAVQLKNALSPATCADVPKA